ncbi:hypothetical protein B0H11DRAFT_1916317 [Mycena galericulata]|nr:hypothetical protein B0H11DRAFT_1916317 [Mycena galericulata]
MTDTQTDLGMSQIDRASSSRVLTGVQARIDWIQKKMSTQKRKQPVPSDKPSQGSMGGGCTMKAAVTYRWTKCTAGKAERSEIKALKKIQATGSTPASRGKKAPQRQRLFATAPRSPRKAGGDASDAADAVERFEAVAAAKMIREGAHSMKERDDARGAAVSEMPKDMGGVNILDISTEGISASVAHPSSCAPNWLGPCTSPCAAFSRWYVPARTMARARASSCAPNWLGPRTSPDAASVDSASQHVQWLARTHIILRAESTWPAHIALRGQVGGEYQHAGWLSHTHIILRAELARAHLCAALSR